MNDLVVITAQQVLVMFLLILVGYLAVRCKALDADARRSFSSLLVNLVVPAMIIDSYMVPFDPAILSNLLRAALASGAVLVAGLLIALAATHAMHDADRPLLRFAVTFSNAGYMGFPLINALFGAEGLLYASIFNTFFNILIWTAGMAILDPKASQGNPLLELAKKPALLAVAAGLVLYLGQIPVPALIAQPISLLGAMNTPLSMLITGAIIATSDLRAVIRSGRLWLILVLRMAVIPAVSFLLCLATGTGGMVGAVVILLVMPNQVVVSDKDAVDGRAFPTLLMVVILASGLVAWWPRNRKALRNRLTVTCTKGWSRLWHDYHTSLGFYALLLLLLMALTGLTWSFGWFRDAAYSLLDFIPDNGQRRFLYSLHTGSWGGMITRILYFLAALIGAFLPWTGYYLWWKKRKRSRQTA